MSHFDYTLSQHIEAQEYTFYALIMAAMRQADTTNYMKLQQAFPGVQAELHARYNSPGGVLSSDNEVEHVIVRDFGDIDLREVSFDPHSAAGPVRSIEEIQTDIQRNGPVPDDQGDAVRAEIVAAHAASQLASQPHYACPVCKMVSFNPNDLEAKYCGNCDKFENER